MRQKSRPSSTEDPGGHLRTAGINDADLAEIAGHRVETMIARYTHAVGKRLSGIRDVVG